MNCAGLVETEPSDSPRVVSGAESDYSRHGCAQFRAILQGKQIPMSSKRILSLIAVVALAACSSPPPSRKQYEAGSSGSGAAPAPRPPIAQADAQALLDTWVAAQNAGNFASYSELYAVDFFGTKRSGKRFEQFAREGWLADRKPKFDRPLKLVATEVVITTTADLATVRFVQDWSSANFRDIGTKELTLRPVDGKLQITREEMLDSKVVDAKAVPPLLPEDFRFVVHAPSKQSYLLLRTPAPRVALTNAQVNREDGLVVATQPLQPQQVPEEFRSWIAKPIQLFNEYELKCRATVYGAAVFARGIYPMMDDPNAQTAYGVFNSVGPSATWLALELRPDRGAECDGAFWARSPDRPAPVIVAGRKSRPSVELDRAFSSTRRWKQNQWDFKQTAAASEVNRWDAYFGAEVEMVSFPGTLGGDTFWTGAEVISEGGPDWYGGHWGLWQKVDATLKILSDDNAKGASPAPLFASDLDGDGQVEFVSSEMVYRQTGPVWQPGLSITPPNFWVE